MNCRIHIKFLDIFVSSIISLFLAIKLYDFLYDKIGWYNLPDFYVGVSIYNNHNKFLDIWIYFIYLILFFIFFPCIYMLSNKFKKKIKIKTAETKSNNIKTSNLVSHIVASSSEPPLCSPFKGTTPKFCSHLSGLSQNLLGHILLKFKNLQYIFPFNFIFLYPFDGNFYPKLLILISILIIITMISVYYCNKNNKGFSIFALTALIFIICFQGYIVNAAPADDHHFGEQFTAFLMHNKFNLEYYQDIMLVHGRKDIIPAMLGNFFFSGNNVQSYCMGDILHRNLLLILTILSVFIAFSKNILYVTPLLLLNTPNAAVMFVSVYLALIKENFMKNYVVWFWVYFVTAIIFASYWTTIGTFWVTASLPAFIYVVYKMQNKKTNLIIAFIILFLLSIIFRNSFFEYLSLSKYYIQGNLYAFGNDFINIENKMPFVIAIEWFYKMFALFFTPVIILEIVNHIKTKDLNKIFFLLFSLIFVIVSLAYTMGRLDNGNFFRLEYISFPFLCLIMPYWFCKFAQIEQKIKFEKILSIVLVIYILYSCFYLLPKKFNISEYQNNAKLFNVGNIKLDENQEKRLMQIKEYLYSKKENEIFLDLTNRGMHYLYFNKKIPVRYTSFYNSISTKQAVETVEKIRKNPPDNILIFSNNILHDNIFPSIRINALYRWIFLNGKYEYKKIDNNIFLEKSNNTVKYDQEELDDLDYYMGAENLKYLPEVWANSLKTLPLKEIITNCIVNQYGRELKIIFFEPQQIKNLDLLYIDTGLDKSSNYTILINNSKSKIKCKSKTGKILVPLDNYPSWLLNENVTEITIETDKPVEKTEVRFYNKLLN